MQDVELDLHPTDSLIFWTVIAGSIFTAAAFVAGVLYPYWS
jgi:hypothetical protein